MHRIVNLALLAIMLVGAIVTYNMKLSAEKAAEMVVRLQNTVEGEKEAIQLLRAEHSMLLQPSRLQIVVERHDDHFKLETLSPSQYTTIDEIPLKPTDVADDEATTDMITDSNPVSGPAVMP